MKTAKNRTTATAVALILTFTMATFMIALPAVQALEIPVYLYITVAPNPAGVGQLVYVSAFTTHPPPTLGSNMQGDRYENMTIEVTRPDGTKETLGPFYSDAVGGIGVSYVPTTVGNYTFQAFYAGQILKGESPYVLGKGTNLHLVGTYMKPAVSEKITLVVQEEPAKNVYVSPPLPTEYWSRPIYSTNFAWAALGGNWWGIYPTAGNLAGGYDGVGNVQLYSTAPNTAHILWTKPMSFGGQVGAPMPGDQESMYFGVTRGVYQWEPIILNGILYYAVYPNYNVISHWEAVDLRTGETLWTKYFPEGRAEALRMGQVLNQHTSTGYYGSAAYLWSIIGSTFKIYEPFTGMYLANITGVTDLSFLTDFDCTEQGTLLGHYTSAGYLRMWNSTQAFAYPTGKTVEIGRIAPTGSINWSAGLGKPGGWSVLLPTTLAGNNISLSISARTPEVILMRDAPVIAGTRISVGYQIAAGYDAKTGDKLWGPLNQTLPLNHRADLVAARDGVYCLLDREPGEIFGYSLTNGKLLWGPIKLPKNAWSNQMYGAEIAYGNVYIWDYGGYVNALDKETGEIKWTFKPRNAGLDTSYGIYSIWCNTGTIADGKIFISESHLYTPPMFPGAKRLVINATTGELVWSILSFSGKSFGAIADGFLVQCNSYDKQIYTFGKGQTATTVAASPKVSVHGSSVLVEGMVTDESAGTKNPDRVARFPNGVPAVADECMSPWMEYVYMQQSRPTNATGVEVTLDTIDPNGNFVHIGTVTTDTSGMYKKMFVPEVPGEYTIIATFAGSESYYASYAETAIGVGEAPPATPPPEYPVPADYTLTIIGTGIAMIIAVAIAAIWIKKK